MTENTLQSYLAENPRMIGVLFMMLLLLSQAGAVTAGSLTVYGP